MGTVWPGKRDSLAERPATPHTLPSREQSNRATSLRPAGDTSHTHHQGARKAVPCRRGVRWGDFGRASRSVGYLDMVRCVLARSKGGGLAVQQSATANVRNRAFLRQIHRKPEKIGLSSGSAAVVHVWCVVVKCSKWFSKPPPSATRPSLRTINLRAIFAIRQVCELDRVTFT